MLISKLYISGIGAITPQPDWPTPSSLESNTYKIFHKHSCIEPDYKLFVDQMALRRMSRIIKMGLISAKMCIKDAAISSPDAIITASGLGCIEDTEKFISSMILNKEKTLNPTPFIQSTHNTIGAQIAINLQCNGYNTTFAHRGHSFESAIFDAILYSFDNSCSNILVGGFDELTTNSIQIFNRLGTFRNTNVQAGEGSVFFVLNTTPTNNNYACLNAIDMFCQSEEISIIVQLKLFLSQNAVDISEIDMVLAPTPVDIRSNAELTEFFKNSNIRFFKYLCGEYHTASAFSLGLAANILKQESSIKRVLIWNKYLQIYHSFFLLSAC